MESLRAWFTTNQVIVFAAYGQVFFTLGVALAVQSMKHTRLELGKHLHWLAAFGLTHGLVEWGYVFIPIQATYLPPEAVETLRWLQLALMITSFVLLLQFGLRTARISQRLTRPEMGWSIAAMLITLSFALGLPGDGSGPQLRDGLEISIRYLLAMPAAAISAVGVFKATADARSMNQPRITRWLTISALSLGGYALLNLVTPSHHQLLKAGISYQDIIDLFVVPAQVWRTLVGCSMLYGMVRSLSLFELETDRLLTEAQERKLLEAQTELESMNQIAMTLGRARNPDLDMKEVLRLILPFLNCDSGIMAVFDEEEGRWRLFAQEGNPPPISVTGHLLPLMAGRVAEGRLVCWEVEDGRTGVAIPISRENKVGAVAAFFRRDALYLSPQEALVLESVGSLMAISLENSRLWAELHRKEADRTRWIGRVIAAQEDERKRIAHELHDEVIQSLILLCQRVDAVLESDPQPAEPMGRWMEGTRESVEQLIAYLRNCARGLRPPALDDLGIAACLRHVLVDLRERTGVDWEMYVEGELTRFDRDVELGLFRIAQEAIRNVERHARAKTVKLEIQVKQEMIHLTVSDDGQGMPGRVLKGGSTAADRLGLLGMQERTALLGGRFAVKSTPGKGTTIEVNVPLGDHTGRWSHVTDSDRVG